MYPILDTLVHTIPLVLCIPSICLAAFCIYVIQVKSTASMKNYKKILIAIALVTLNFDISLSVIIGPKPLPGAIGLENNGFLALAWPTTGRIQIFYITLSFIGQFEICVIGFSYREKTILKNTLASGHKRYEAFQVMTYILITVGLSIVFFAASVDEEEAREWMDKVGSPYCQECSLFVVTNPSTLLPSGLFALSCVVSLNTFIGVSIYRIRRYLSQEKGNLSDNTIKMQKMLLNALIWQYLIPVILIAIPTVLMTIALLIVPLIRNNFEPQPLGEDMTAICLMMPAFFSIGHCFCTIYFTAPYKKYVVDLFTGKARIVPTRTPLTHFSISRPVNTSRIFNRD